jgi:hypothetical protein
MKRKMKLADLLLFLQVLGPVASRRKIVFDLLHSNMRTIAEALSAKCKTVY